METNNTIQENIISKEMLKHWYRAANRLTIAHFSATFDSFWHKEEIAPVIGNIGEKINSLQQFATDQAKEALDKMLLEIQKLKGENFVQGTTLANLHQTTKTILELLEADDKDIDALRELITLVNQNITKIENLTSKKLDKDEFNRWLAEDFTSLADDFINHTHSEFADNHTHENKAVLNQITAAFTTALLQKLDGIEAGANNYVHPQRPASGNDETTTQTKFVSGITTDDKGHLVKLITKDVNKPNAPLILNSSGVIDTAFLPSYVDDVLEFERLSNLPSVGESGKIYVVFGDSSENNGQYRWSGTAYICISQKIDIASDTEAGSGVNDTKIVTPLKMLSAFLYWLGSKAIGAFTKSNTAVNASDSVVSAIGKLQGQLEATVPISKGGTGATTAQQARTNLGITPANIGAAPSVHTHSVAEIADLQNKLNEKAPTSHNHDSMYEPKDLTLQGQKHSHSNKSVLDGITSTLITKWNGLVSFVGFAQNGVSVAGKAVEANDSRLSDARTPTAHSHTGSDLPTYPTQVTYNNKYHASYNEQLKIALTNPSDPGNTQKCTSIGYLHPNSPTVNGTTGVITAKGFYQN